MEILIPDQACSEFINAAEAGAPVVTCPDFAAIPRDELNIVRVIERDDVPECHRPVLAARGAGAVLVAVSALPDR